MDLDYLSLVDAYFARAEFSSAVPELRNYHRKKVDALEHALCFSLSSPNVPACHATNITCGHESRQRPEMIAEWLRWVAGMCIERHAQVDSPFPVRLERRPDPLEARLCAEHEPRITRAMTELRQAHRALLSDIVRCLDPAIVDRRVSQDRLFELGLPRDEPDPVDFI